MRKLAVSINLLLVLCVLATCGASQREKTIKTTLAAVNDARDMFIVLDSKIQNAIADSAKSVEDGIARLDAYKKKREAGVAVFEAAYRSIAIAATANDEKSVVMMLSTIAQVKQLIETLKGLAP